MITPIQDTGGTVKPAAAIAVRSRLDWTDRILYQKGLPEQLYKISVRKLDRVPKHIRRFMNFCAERGYIEKVFVVMPKYETELKEPYTDEEMSKLLEKPITNSWIEWRNWAMVNYFFYTGQRLSSALNVKIKDIDFNLHTVKLTWNKDKIQKEMPLSSALIEVLKEYIELSGLEKDEFLFPQANGQQLRRRGAEQTIADYNNSRGVQKTSIHLFRHSFSKNYIVNGGNPMKLQKLLNHKNISITMKYVNLYGADVAVDLDTYDPLKNPRNKEKLLL